ncbi:urease accessory protein UreF [Chamaesiphon minutus]|uniref:Urease accessory protein UreF n=1 Tax=Chamaesiphon minutus (strain ATCC 27169 / PCC 6605) TaxID=1173020 RepID=K9UEP1_CHAP6|nr:urease accessory UreF family protein [Chamaesiphon minutus]AFY93592.1 urease accessory protein UreF [Chamaesiphon minutus PCC 6605]
MIDSRLALMQLSDSFFPSGSFTLSHGLEAMVQTNQIHNPQDIETFLYLLLHNKVGCSDLIALIHAYRASTNNDLTEVRRADACLYAQMLIQTTREAQQRSGQALLMVARSTWNDPQLAALQEDIDVHKTPGLHPIVFAMVGRAIHLSEIDTSFAFLHNFVTGIVSAAIRLGVLGHLGAQQILSEMAQEIDAIVSRSRSLSLDDMWSGTPAIDIAQMSHHRLTSKQFST